MAFTDNLVAYWKCDEASGNLLDAHGSNNLTDGNSVTSGTGKISGCRMFTRANQELFSTGDNLALSMGDIPMALSLWVNLSSNNVTQVLLAKGNDVTSATTFEYGVYYTASSGGKFVFRVRGGPTNLGLNSVLTGPATGTWYHICCWHDPSANTIGIRVNGDVGATASFSSGIEDGTGDFRLGTDADVNRYLNGALDEIGIWKRLLTTPEQDALYNGGNGFAYPLTRNPELVDGGRVNMPGLINGGLAA